MRSNAGEPRDLVRETFRDYADGVVPDEAVGTRAFRAPFLLRLQAREAVTLALLVVDLTALVLAAADAAGTVRFLTGLVTALAVPGWAIVSHLDLRWAAAEVALSVAGSLAIVLLVAQSMVMTRSWGPAAATWAIGGISAVLLVARLDRYRRDHQRIGP
jgi:uncharacterized membrane protein